MALNDPNTLLLIHGDAVLDVSDYNVNLVNTGVTITSAQSKFGTTSLYFNGSKTVYASIDIPGDYTIDFWAYLLYSSTNTYPVSINYAAGDSSRGLWVYFMKSATMLCDMNNSGDLVSDSSDPVPNGGWHHYAITRRASNNQMIFYVDGVATQTITGITTNFATLYIGSMQNSGGTYFTGYMDEIRLSDIIRWTSNFTPPTEPYGFSLDAPTIQYVDVNQWSGVITIGWSSVSGATDYKIYRNGTYIAEVSGTYYNDSDTQPFVSYEYKIIATNGTVDSEPATASAMWEYLDAPTNLQATVSSTGLATLTWNPVANAQGYYLDRNGSPLATLYSNSYQDQLEPNVSYQYLVYAFYGDIMSDPSNPCDVEWVYVAPPTNLQYTASDSAITLTWNASSDATGYNVYRDNVLLTSVTGTTYTDNTISANVTYQYSVCAYNAQGALSDSISVNAVWYHLDAPSNFKATSSEGSIVLTWTPNAYATGYRVYKNGSLLSTVTTSAYTDTAIETNVSYSYGVLAYSDHTESTQSTLQAAYINVDPPTGLSATPSSTQIQLTWSASAPRQTFIISRDGAQIGTTENTTYTDTFSVSPNTQYTYSVAASALGQTGTPATVFTTWHYLTPPANLRSSISNGTVTLTWNTVSAATGYKVYKNNNYVQTVTNPTYSDTVIPFESNTYDVYAYNSYTTSEKSSITVVWEYLNTPTGLTALPSDGTIALSWDSVDYAQGYVVYRDSSVLATISGTTYTDSTVEANVTYEYSVRAYNGSTQSSAATISATWVYVDAPTNLQSSVQNGTVTLTWNAVTDAQGYKVYRNGDLVSTISTTTFSESIQANISYQYSVRAYLDNVVSDPTSITVIWSYLNPPTNLQSSVTNGSLTLTWSAVSGATGYNVYRDNTFVSAVSSPLFTQAISANTTYQYAVSAYNADTESSQTTISVIWNYLAPPANLTASVSNGVAALSWSPVQDAEGYQVYRDDEKIATVQSTNYSDSILPDISYTYKVIAFLGETTSNPSIITVKWESPNPPATQKNQFMQYLDALQKPFIKLCRLRFLYPDGSTAFALDNNPYNKRSGAFIQSGQLTVNLQNGQRRSANVQLSNLDDAYDYNVNNVWFGQQIALDEGLVLPDGTEFYLPQGVFYVSDPTETFKPGQKTADYNLVDKWAYLDGTLFGNLEGTYEVPINTNIYQTIASILQLDRGNGYPVDNVTPVFTAYYNGKTQTLPSGETALLINTPYTYREDSDSATYSTLIENLAGMLAAWIGYDKTGTFRLDASQDDIVDATKPVQWSFSPENSSFLGATYTIKNTEVYNDVIVYGETMDDNSQPAARAQNQDYNSDTNIYKIGKKTIRLAGTGYYTDQLCQDFAQWKLKRMTVLQKSVSISCQQIFHISENELVTICRTDKPGSPVERHLVQGFTRPLTQSGEMTINAVSTEDFPIATLLPWPPES